MSRVIHPWQEVTVPEQVNGPLQSMLDTVDELRIAWKRSIDRATPEEFAEARRRTLRRHAIETGIIERLYDVSWGVTDTVEERWAEIAELIDQTLAAAIDEFSRKLG